MVGIRHKARVAAMQTISTLLLRNTVLTEDVEKTMKDIKDEFFPQANENELYRLLVFGVIKNRTSLDTQLSKKAPKWDIKKMAAVDRSILEIGLFELQHTDTPFQIVINEAVEIAKEFGDDGSGKFVNGVLSNFINKTEETTEKNAE